MKIFTLIILAFANSVIADWPDWEEVGKKDKSWKSIRPKHIVKDRPKNQTEDRLNKYEPLLAVNGWKKTQNNVEAKRCSFNSIHYKDRKTTANKCGPMCNFSKKCTHYSYKNGVCHFHSGPTSRSYAMPLSDPKSRCGFSILLSDSWRIDMGAVMADQCDFLTETFRKENVKDLRECVRLCKKTTQCTHFAIYRNNCYLKKGKVSKMDAFHSNYFTPWVGTNQIFDRNNVCGIPISTCKLQGNCKKN